MQILIVDDDKVTLNALSALLELLNYEFTATQDPQEALKILREFKDSGNPFDLLITDFHMPVWSGVTLALHVRNVDRQLPIIMITGTIEDASPINKRDGSPVNLILSKGSIRAKDLKEAVDKITCCTCRQIIKTGGPSHNGSINCKSGSIASHGQNSHCSCDICF